MNKKTFEQIRCSRQVHLVDAENLCGSSHLTEAMVASMRSAYFAVVKPGKNDIFIVTASHHNQLAVMFGWPGG